ncbi:hypothetical protein WN982_13390 [Paraburkholderia sp. IMGN_8]|uniref:hypothetical protein n=1 Tax=Paraburkholderia sp. IMGN_8 TaxID=3136564 RepID=UPI003101A13C
MKSRTPSDSAIVAIFRDKRKPQNAVRSAFPLDFMAIFRRYANDMAAALPFLQGGSHRSSAAADESCKKICPYLCTGCGVQALDETCGARRSILTAAWRDR